MARRSLLLTVLTALLTLVIGNACGQGYDPQSLLASADEEIFIRGYFTQDFTENQGYVNEFPNEKTIHQYFIYDGVGTDRLVSLLPAEETVHTTNKRLIFEQIRLSEFHITYSLQKSDAIPSADSGTCWLRFSNVVMQGAGKESGVIFYPGDAAYFFSPSESGMQYENIADLSGLDPEEMNSFDFIRLEGTTYVYANGGFLFKYNDGIRDPISFEAGAELFEGGNCIRCDFDDFTVKIR